MKFCDYIRKAREAAGISQAQAATHAGVTRENYNNFENDRKPLKDEGLISLAPHIGLDPERILYYKASGEYPELFANGKPNLSGPVALPDMVMVPVFTNKVAAGRGLCVQDAEQSIEWYEPVPAKLVRNPKDSVFFEVEGDSMEERLYDGDLVLVDCSLEPQSGHLVVVQVDDHLYVKKLQAKGNQWILHSYNKKYTPIMVEKGFQQCWRVVNIWGKG